MVRRKSALVLILIGMMVVILSPWTEIPQTVQPEEPIPEGETVPVAAPALEEQPSRLIVAVPLEGQAYSRLFEQNEAVLRMHPDWTVELVRVDPAEAYPEFIEDSQLEEAADVMLVKNEWVSDFAASGYLMPADAAFVGKALAEQFEALSAPLKWNGYMWGVPRDFDPFVVAWNRELLRSWLGEDVVLPLAIEQWTALTAKHAELQGAVPWLLLDPKDPLALLSWLENASGERTDGLWEEGSLPWDAGATGLAMSLLDQQKAGVGYAEADAALRQLAEGHAVAAVVPYSATAKLAGADEQAYDKLEIDRSAWKLPFVWPRGNSFVVSSGSEVEETAMAWIAAMTDPLYQIENEETTHVLPVYRSVYDSDRRLANLIPARSEQSFPNEAPLYGGADLPDRFEELGTLWTDWTTGKLTLDDWKQRWSELEAD